TTRGNLFGAGRSYRAEDFRSATGPEPQQVGSGILSWALGYQGSLGLASSNVVSDRPEAIPRKMQVLAQDVALPYEVSELATAPEFTKLPNVYADGFEEFGVSIKYDPLLPYLVQRITIENRNAGFRWSADARPDSPATFARVIARPSDTLTIIRNRRTYGVVSLFGYGIGVFDLNAIESNDASVKPEDYETLRESVRVTRAALSASCSHSFTDGAIPDLTFSPEAAILADADGAGLRIYALDASRGILDLLIDPEPDPLMGEEALAGGDVFCARGPMGMLFRSKGTVPPDNPRLHAMRAKFEALASRPPFGRFNSISTHHWRIEKADNFPIVPGSTIGQRGTKADEAAERDYLLVAGNEYGVLVAEAPENGFIEEQHLADVIWIPEGAASVRAIPGSQLASVVDGQGHLLLVDLSRIDERRDDAGALIGANALFPTLAASLQKNGMYGIGLADPRIIWRSENPVASGTLAPLVDPDLGIVYAGELLRKTLRVIAAIDPRLRVMIDVDGFLTETGGIVPLGISQAGTGVTAPGALGAFRFELSLPGALAESIGGALRLAIESERVFGAVTEQTPDGFPRAHLRQLRPDGTPDPRAAAEFKLRRLVPEALEAEFRHQRGFNRFVSPWIVAVADPRASEQYTWPDGTTATQKAEAGCANCERPEHLKNKAESSEGAFEIWSAGRQFVVRPELPPMPPPAADEDPGYRYLASADRLVARVPTTIAATVRPTGVLVAGQEPPIADGLIQETIYAHSGELETFSIDLDAGGRAGWNVVIDRTYRSRTIGNTPFGEGWSSSLFRRLRALPNGDVEYRDEAGEVWTFRRHGTIYHNARGLFLALGVQEYGWSLADPLGRVIRFDSMGRLLEESDHFFTPLKPGSGNLKRYLYGPTGQLAAIVDPVGRTTLLSYYSEASSHGGLLREVQDWRGRKVTYHYDEQRRLVRVQLPEAGSVPGVPAEYSLVDGKRPELRYEYQATGASFRDRVEIAGNLTRIIEPAQVASTLIPRVEHEFDASMDPVKRDRVVRQIWPCGSTVAGCTPAEATFDWGVHLALTDVLGQIRTFQVAQAPDGRMHLERIRLHDVPVLHFAAGTSPAA
ncbi:MAG: DUF6531 domain-containing protein, partial [Thermoanaerobaculia bacterium]